MVFVQYYDTCNNYSYDTDSDDTYNAERQTELLKKYCFSTRFG